MINGVFHTFFNIIRILRAAQHMEEGDQGAHFLRLLFGFFLRHAQDRSDDGVQHVITAFPLLRVIRGGLLKSPGIAVNKTGIIQALEPLRRHQRDREQAGVEHHIVIVPVHGRIIRQCHSAAYSQLFSFKWDDITDPNLIILRVQAVQGDLIGAFREPALHNAGQIDLFTVLIDPDRMLRIRIFVFIVQFIAVSLLVRHCLQNDFIGRFVQGKMAVFYPVLIKSLPVGMGHAFRRDIYSRTEADQYDQEQKEGGILSLFPEYLPQDPFSKGIFHLLFPLCLQVKKADFSIAIIADMNEQIYSCRSEAAIRFLLMVSLRILPSRRRMILSAMAAISSLWVTIRTQLP